MMRRLFFALLLAMPCIGSAVTDPDPVVLQKQADAAVTEIRKQQPAYALLAEQQSGFLVNWREQLRQFMAVNGSRNTQNASRAIATALGLNASTAYLSRSDDAAIDSLLVQQRRLMAMAQTDVRLCGILLNTTTARLDENGHAPWLLRKPYRALQPDLESALFQIVTSAQDKAPRTLPEGQNQQFTQRIAARIGERYGREGLEDLERMQNDNTAPTLRCRGVSRLLEAIAEQPPELRAQLMRIYFGQ
jgi:hypothetical protein